MGRFQDNQSNNVQGDPHQEHNYLDGVATEKSQEIQSQNVQRHQRQEHNYLDRAMESSSPEESDRDNEHRQEKDKISQCARPIQARSAKEEEEDEPKLLSLLEAASVELVATGRISDPSFLPGWLYDKEKKSSRSYFENVTTPRNEVFWKDEARLTSRRYSKNDRKRDRARRAANRHMVIDLKIPKNIKVLLASTADSSKEWQAVNFVYDIARVKPEGKNAMAADWETVAVLLIRLLIGSPSYTKFKILELLQILAEVYIAKLMTPRQCLLPSGDRTLSRTAACRGWWRCRRECQRCGRELRGKKGGGGGALLEVERMAVGRMRRHSRGRGEGRRDLRHGWQWTALEAGEEDGCVEFDLVLAGEELRVRFLVASRCHIIFINMLMKHGLKLMDLLGFRMGTDMNHRFLCYHTLMVCV